MTEIDTDTSTRAAAIFASMVREAEERERAEERARARQRLEEFLQVEAFRSGDSPTFVPPSLETSPNGQDVPVLGEARVAKLERLSEFVREHAAEATPAQLTGFKDAAVRSGGDVNALRETYGVRGITRRQMRRAEKAFDRVQRVLGPLATSDVVPTWGDQ
jgi:hypothetical protein